jgi:hypothetical protein
VLDHRAQVLIQRILEARTVAIVGRGEGIRAARQNYAREETHQP